eukprot:Em0514g4a
MVKNKFSSIEKIQFPRMKKVFQVSQEVEVSVPLKVGVPQKLYPLDKLQELLMARIHDELMIPYEDLEVTAETLGVNYDINGASHEYCKKHRFAISKALTYMHGRDPRVIHHDIKPSNIMMCLTRYHDTHLPISTLFYVQFTGIHDHLKACVAVSGVFLAVAEKHIVSKNLVIGVQVGNDTFHSSLDVRELELNAYFDIVCPNLTHKYIVVRCNASFSYSTSHAALLYKTEPNGVILSAVSENRPIVNVMPRRSNERMTIVSCLAPGHGNPRLLPHWIRYERTIGVSHVHVIADQSFVESGALNTSVVKRALETGFLSIAIWPRRFTSWQVFYREQLLAYQDCVHLFQGLYDYVFPHDADDFFVPLIAGAKLDYYVNTYCTKGTCSFQWEEITPPYSGLTGMIGRDGNVTDKVAAKHSRKTREANKCIHRLEDTFEVGIHGPAMDILCCMTTYVPATAAYVSHIRY